MGLPARAVLPPPLGDRCRRETDRGLSRWWMRCAPPREPHHPPGPFRERPRVLTSDEFRPPGSLPGTVSLLSASDIETMRTGCGICRRRGSTAARVFPSPRRYGVRGPGPDPNALGEHRADLNVAPVRREKHRPRECSRPVDGARAWREEHQRRALAASVQGLGRGGLTYPSGFVGRAGCPALGRATARCAHPPRGPAR